MSKWPEDAAQKSRDRQQANEDADKLALQNRNTLNNKGRALWGDLKMLLGKKCIEYNGEHGNTGVLSMVGHIDDLTVCFTMRSEMINGLFGNDQITLSGKNGVKYERTFHVRLTPDKIGVWLAENEQGLPVNLDELAGEIIETLLKAGGR